MSPLFSCRDVSIRDLEFDDQWNLHPYLPPGSEDDALIHSIEQVGLLVPPLVRAKLGNRLEVISGRRRIEASRQVAGEDQVVCCRLIDPSAPAQQTLQLTLEDHLLSGPLSVMEQAYFFRLCGLFLDEAEVIETMFDRLGLKKNAYVLHHTNKLLALEHPLQVSLHDQKISENLAHDLLQLPAASREALHALFRQHHIGAGKQKRLFQLLRDIARRNDQTIAGLLRRQDIQEILTHQAMNSPQKVHNLLNLLQQLDTPAMHQAEIEFARWHSTLDLPKTCRVEHSKSFERDELTLSLTVESKTKLERIWQQLQTFLDAS